jgi:hypothetical protein
MDARSVRLSGENNMAQSNQSRKLHWLAIAHCQERDEILSRNNRNTKGAPQPDKKKCQIHKTQAIQDNKLNTVARKEGSRCAHPSV